MASALELPKALDLMPYDEVEELITTTQQGIRELEQLAEGATVAADHAEHEARAGGAHPGATPWVLVRFRGFLDDLRHEVERDVATMLAVTEHQARQHVNRARAKAGLELLPSVPHPSEVSAAPPKSASSATHPHADWVPPELASMFPASDAPALLGDTAGTESADSTAVLSVAATPGDDLAGSTEGSLVTTDAPKMRVRLKELPVAALLEAIVIVAILVFVLTRLG